jgi:hypothetical protein
MAMTSLIVQTHRSGTRTMYWKWRILRRGITRLQIARRQDDATYNTFLELCKKLFQTEMVKARIDTCSKGSRYNSLQSISKSLVSHSPVLFIAFGVGDVNKNRTAFTLLM